MEGNLAYLVPERITIALIFVYTGICNRKLGLESPYITKETKKKKHFWVGFLGTTCFWVGGLGKFSLLGSRLKFEVRGGGVWCITNLYNNTP